MRKNTLQTPSPSVPVTTPSTPVENKQQEIIQQQPATANQCTCHPEKAI